MLATSARNAGREPVPYAPWINPALLPARGLSIPMDLSIPKGLPISMGFPTPMDSPSPMGPVHPHASPLPLSPPRPNPPYLAEPVRGTAVIYFGTFLAC